MSIQIWWGAEFSLYLAAEFDWEAVNPKILEQAINISSIGWDKKPNPHYLAKFDVKLTLTKHHSLVPWDGAQSRKTPEGILIDSAYQPEKYTLTLEKGFFQHHVSPTILHNTHLHVNMLFGLCLINPHIRLWTSGYLPTRKWYHMMGSLNGLSLFQGTYFSVAELQCHIILFNSNYDSKQYYQFNVDQGLQDIGLAEYQEQVQIEAATKGYLNHQAVRFQVWNCIQSLELKAECVLRELFIACYLFVNYY